MLNIGTFLGLNKNVRPLIKKEIVLEKEKWNAFF